MDILTLWNSLLVHPVMNLTLLAYSIVHDFGLAIIFVTILIRLALYPLYVTQIRSQRAMQEVAPAMDELKKKYGKDRQRFSQEQMKLYKERGVNPAAGCLPLLLQMPLLIALYNSLLQLGCGLGPPPNNECPGLTHDMVESFRYTFISNPIPPGGALDTTAHWLPWITQGLQHRDPLYIIPVVAGLVQLVASVMAMPAKQAKSDDPSVRMTQSMAYTFPLITVVIGANFPAGLGLYWIATTVFQIVQQYFVSGWGQLPKYLPFLRGIPTPADRDLHRREQAAIAEARKDMADQDSEEAEEREEVTAGRGRSNGGRRRGRRRGKR
ncbi:MAG TPA: YidC/Oxa1 family membrane protein insertase [Candidatus Limnocylindria bacterium]|jgi:YidC/Oxa1 family membrane protein insertase|nr:YidC/Oxa1 family membrane protein insertase [Candidatus Limnocylindria bacterium]